MNKFLLAALIAQISASAYGQYCPSCVQASANPSNAVFNVASGTVRGQLTVGSLEISSFTATSSVTASAFFGNGSALTGLNSTQLLSGTVPSARLSGSYSNVTGVGSLASGVWNSSIIGTQYGGTGGNMITASTGSIPYFNHVGSMTALAPGTATYLLQTNGSNAAPSWTHVPQVLGTNVTAIPMANLITGELPMGISINDASISTVSAAKVIGNIPGNAVNITGNLPVNQLASGTLSVNNPASSVTASGVAPGIWGGPARLIQATVGSDGRITAISHSTFSVRAASITAGAFASGVTIAASQVSSGFLGNSVVASSLAATGVTPGSYGFASQTSSITVRGDGRISFANNVPIAINTSQINNGTLTAGVLVPATNIQAGSLASNVVASSLAVNGVTAGVCGSASLLCVPNIHNDGRIYSWNQYPISGLSTSAVLNNVDNAWVHSQTFLSGSSLTITGNLSASAIVAATFAGDGSGVNNIDPTSISGGVMSSAVVASSASLPFLHVPGNLLAGSDIDSSGNISANGSLNGASVNTIDIIATGDIYSGSSVTASAFFGDGLGLTGVTVTDSTKVAKAGDTMTGALTLSGVNGDNLSLIVANPYNPNTMQFGSNMDFHCAGGFSSNSGFRFYTDISGDETQVILDQATNDLIIKQNCGMTGGQFYFRNGSYFESLNGFYTVSSVTASSFFGDGSHLTAVSGTDTSKVAKAGDTMTGALNLTNVAVTLTGANGYVATGSSVTASAFFGSGSDITGLTPANVSSGIFPNTVQSGALKNSSLSDLASETPSALGLVRYCTDCTVDTIAVSTQIVTASWSRVTDKTIPVQ